MSGLVSSDVTTSTSLSTGTGLKKWMPMTDAGRLVAMASFMIGIDDVLEARMAPSSVDDPVEPLEHGQLDRLGLDHRLDHQLAVGQVVVVGA